MLWRRADVAGVRPAAAGVSSRLLPVAGKVGLVLTDELVYSVAAQASMEARVAARIDHWDGDRWQRWQSCALLTAAGMSAGGVAR